MSEKVSIEITIEDDRVSVVSDLTAIEVNYWLDHIKYLIASGKMQTTIE